MPYPALPDYVRTGTYKNPVFPKFFRKKIISPFDMHRFQCMRTFFHIKHPVHPDNRTLLPAYQNLYLRLQCKSAQIDQKHVQSFSVYVLTNSFGITLQSVTLLPHVPGT